MTRFIPLLALLLWAMTATAQSWIFHFTNATKGPGIRLTPANRYSDAVGYGFEYGTPQPGGPYFFSVKVPDGNYRIRATFGSSRTAGHTTLRAESRRMYVNGLTTRKGETVTRTFIVNKRDTLIGNKVRVEVKRPLEAQKLLWDNRLTFEVTGNAPVLQKLEIEPATDVPTIYLIGNSTVVDNDYEPYTSWGQMITAFFNDSLAVANYAESGLAASTFVAQKRFDKIKSLLRPGDYVFIEFAHNDQKQTHDGAGARYNFAYNMKIMIDATRRAGAVPVLLTPTRRRIYNADGTLADTHADYPQAIREMASREGLALIDLQHMTKVLCETLGEEASRQLYVHFPAGTYPGQNKELKDNTHFRPYGAYEVARCVLEGMRYNGLPLVRHVLPEYTAGFSPSMPDPYDGFQWTPSTRTDATKPDGN